jgi:hypothetical protein
MMAGKTIVFNSDSMIPPHGLRGRSAKSVRVQAAAAVQ